MLKKFLLACVFLVLLSSPAFAYIDLNVNSWAVADSNNYIGNIGGSRTFMLDFNVMDTNAAMRDLNARISFGASAATASFRFGGHAIAGNDAWKNGGTAGHVFDLNLNDMNRLGTCTGISTAFVGGMRCKWKWDFNYPLTDANYFDGNKVIDINVFDWTNDGVCASNSDGNNDSNSFYLDMTAPDLNTVYPSANIAGSESSIPFSSRAGDVNSGLYNCIAFVQYDNAVLTTASTVTPSANSCSKTVSLNWMQLAEVDFRGFDRSGNYTDVNTYEFEYSISGGGTPANIVEGGSGQGAPSVYEPAVAPVEQVPPQLYEAVQAGQVPTGNIPIVSDVIKGLSMVWEMLLNLFKFR